MMTTRILSVQVLTVISCGLLSGCTLFFPAHRNSNHRADEVVKIELLTFQDFDDALEKDYEAATPFQDAEGGTKSIGAVAASIGAAAVGFAVDYTAKELKEEATLYEAQFKARALRPDFWTSRSEETIEPKAENAEEPKIDGPLVQRYRAIRITRQIPDGGGMTDAFRCILGIYPTQVHQLFTVAPLQFQTSYAKTKVLSDELWWWFLPTSWLGKIMKHDDHCIDTTVEVEMNGYWRGRDKDLHITKLAGFSLSFNSYDLNENELWRASEADNFPMLPMGPQAFFVSAPLSYVYDEKKKEERVVGLGAFSTDVVVTERDRSNAKKHLTELSKLVAEQKEKLVEKAKAAGKDQ